MIFSSLLILVFPELFTQFPVFVEKTLNYSLYSALPNNSHVLGQFIGSEDARIAVLADYLRNQRSPMAGNSSDFVQAADMYNLPWTLLPSIAGKESGFGKAIPKNSFNAFGWGVFTGQQTGVNFTSWENSIYTVAKGLREKYFDRGLSTPELIEPYYTPQSPAKGHPWLHDVLYFMNEIENWKGA